MTFNKEETGPANPVDSGENPSLEYMIDPLKWLSMLAYNRIYLGNKGQAGIDVRAITQELKLTVGGQGGSGCLRC